MYMEEDEKANGKVNHVIGIPERVVQTVPRFQKGARIINDYMEGFDQLANRNDLEKTKVEQIARFVKKLWVSI